MSDAFVILPWGVATGGKASSHEAAENLVFMYSLFESCKMNDFKDIKIAVVGIGYVGLSIVTLLSQRDYVMVVEAIHI